MLPKDIYTVQEIRSQIASNDYNAEMMLQHLLLRYDELEKKYAQAVSRQVIINEDDQLRDKPRPSDLVA